MTYIRHKKKRNYKSTNPVFKNSKCCNVSFFVKIKYNYNCGFLYILIIIESSTSKKDKTKTRVNRICQFVVSFFLCEHFISRENAATYLENVPSECIRTLCFITQDKVEFFLFGKVMVLHKSCYYCYYTLSFYRNLLLSKSAF